MLEQLRGARVTQVLQAATEKKLQRAVEGLAYSMLDAQRDGGQTCTRGGLSLATVYRARYIACCPIVVFLLQRGSACI